MELLVAISVVGLLTLMVLAAVARSRESARRLECVNRLKQIGLAVHGHEAATGVFPTAMPPRIRLPSGTPSSTEQLLSGFYELLPHLDQVNLHNAINVSWIRLSDDSFSMTVPRQASNRTAFTTRVEAFLCPSDGRSSRGESAGVSYRFDIGAGNWSGVTFQGVKPGAFVPIQPAAASAYNDGLSMTVGFGERVRGSGRPPGSFDPFRDYWHAEVSSLIDVNSDDDTRRVCGSLQGTPLDASTDLGGSWMLSGAHHEWFNHVAPPNDRSTDCTTSDLSGGEKCHSCSIAARSLHGNVVNVLLMDGSVRPIRDGIALSVWRALGTRSGGEPLDAGW